MSDVPQLVQYLVMRRLCHANMTAAAAPLHSAKGNESGDWTVSDAHISLPLVKEANSSLGAHAHKSAERYIDPLWSLSLTPRMYKEDSSVLLHMVTFTFTFTFSSFTLT